jgi:hypothetical protein
MRFSFVTAIFYALFTILIITVYFITGMLSGGIVAVIFLFIGFGKGGAGFANDQNTVYDPSRSERWNKLERFQSNNT